MAPEHLRRPIIYSIAASILTFGLKFFAYYMTQSVGLLSDAVESSVNLIASVTAFASLLYAAQPVDLNHTYGHKKIEFFSSGLEGVLVIVAAFGIAWYAIQRLWHPQPLSDLGIGTMVSLIASLINFGVAVLLLRTGRKYGSIVLEADGQHLMTDVWTSISLIAGLTLVWLTGIEQLDPILALGMSFVILKTGFDLVVRSFHGLMDHALPAAEVQSVRTAIDSCLIPGVTYHALRTRQAGMNRFIDFHLLVPGRMEVVRAHQLGETMEQAVAAVLPGTEVSIHFEPIEDQASWQDSALLAVEKNQKP